MTLSKKAALGICISTTFAICLLQLLAAHSCQERTKVEGNVKNHYGWESIDSMSYILYAEEPLNTWRNHWNWDDNYPEGRPNHYSSIPTMALKLSGWIYQEGEKLCGSEIGKNEAIEKAAIIWNPLLVLLAGGLLATILLNISTPTIATNLYLAVLFLPTRTRAFLPYYAHHRGIAIILAAAFLISLWLAYRNPKKTYFVLAGGATGIGVWISSFNSLPYITVGALCTLLAAIYNTNPESKRQWAQGWKTLGKVAAGISLLGWAIEYMPHIPKEIEINSPLLSLLLLSGSYTIATILNTIGSQKNQKEQVKDIAIIVACALPTLAWLATYQKSCLTVLSPAVYFLIRNTTEVARSLEPSLFQYGSILLLFGLAFLSKEKNGSKTFALTASFLLLAMSTGAKRLQEPTTTLAAILLTLTIASSWRKSNLHQGALGILLALTTLAAARTYNQTMDNLSGITTPEILTSTKNEAQLAKNLNTWGAQTGRIPVLLCDRISDCTDTLFYLNEGKIISSAYWENKEGLEKAASILGNPNEEEALQNLHQSGITHLQFCGIPNALLPYIQARYGAKSYSTLTPSLFPSFKWKTHTPKELKELGPGIFEVIPKTP